jgi:hypothetical protein
MTSIAELNVVGETILRLLGTSDAAVALVRSASDHGYHAVTMVVGENKLSVPASLMAYDDCPAEMYTAWRVRMVHHGLFHGIEVYNALVQLNEFGLRVGIEVFNLDPDSVQKGRLFRVVESSTKGVLIESPTKLPHPMFFYGQRWQLVEDAR